MLVVMDSGNHKLEVFNSAMVLRHFKEDSSAVELSKFWCMLEHTKVEGNEGCKKEVEIVEQEKRGKEETISPEYFRMGIVVKILANKCTSDCRKNQSKFY